MVSTETPICDFNTPAIDFNLNMRSTISTYTTSSRQHFWARKKNKKSNSYAL